MNKQIKYSILIILTIAMFIGLVRAQPTPIGTTLQPNPFDSNPSADALSGFTATQVPLATQPNMWDGNLAIGETVTLFTSLASSPASAYINLTGFSKPASPTFNPTWIQISVNLGLATVTSTTKNTLTILLTIPGQGFMTLKPATVLNTTIVQQSIPFSQLARPGGGSWTWTDIQQMTVQLLFTKGTTTWCGRTLNVNEIWATIYGSSTPPTNGGGTTLSVQPAIPYGVDANSAVPAIFVEVYVNNVHDLFSYEFNMTVDGAVLTPIEADVYGPWTSAAGGSPIFDPSATPSWVYIAFTMPPPVPVGSAFTGNSPLVRIYFLINAVNSASDITFKLGTVILGDSTGTQIPATVYNGHYQFSTPPVPEFPFGISLVLALAPAAVIIYLWRTRPKRRVK